MKLTSQLAFGLVLTSALSACGDSSSSSSDSAKATFKMTNTETAFMEYQRIERMLSSPIEAFSVAYSAPSSFGIKLIAAYLAVDVDEDSQNNVGGTTFIYLNPLCNDDISHCDISAGVNDREEPVTEIVSDYFDLSGSTTEVNEALNSQRRTVDAATYKYVRLEFCKYNSGDAENIRWQGGAMGATQDFQRNMCTVTSQEMDPPLTIADGDTITVNLAYDISESVSIGTDASGDNCYGTPGAADYTCFSLPTFTPSVD